MSDYSMVTLVGGSTLRVREEPHAVVMKAVCVRGPEGFVQLTKVSPAETVYVRARDISCVEKGL